MMLADRRPHLRPAFFTQGIINLATVLTTTDRFTVTQEIDRGGNPVIHCIRHDKIGHRVSFSGERYNPVVRPDYSTNTHRR
jgi:hypothetical protein